METTTRQEGGCDGLLVQISLFGGLSIQIGGQMIKDSSSRGYQLWSLLEYLIAFRHRTIPPEEIYAALWEDNPVDNPASALKNLVYRIRTLLVGYEIPFAKHIILYAGGTYQWNNDIPCVVDTEEFEALHLKAGNSTLPTELRIDYCLRAIGLYTGDFLADSTPKNWIPPVKDYYKSLYFQCVCQVLQLLHTLGRYPEMEAIARQALTVDRHHEAVHRYMLLSFIGQGDGKQAAGHYQQVARLYQQELGVPLPPSLRELYRQIGKVSLSSETDLDVIRQDLRESCPGEGAIYCDYSILKHIYQVLSRWVTRTGQSVFLALLTLADDHGETSPLHCSQRMSALLEVIQANTQHCDVFARFSDCQYVLLLPTASLDQCDLVLERIQTACRKHPHLADIELRASAEPADLDILSY